MNLIDTIHLFDGHIYGNFLVNNILHNNYKIENNQKIHAYMPHSAETFFERLYSREIKKETKRYPSPTSRIDLNIMYEKEYLMSIDDVDLIFVARYILSLKDCMALTRLKTEIVHFDVDLLYMSRREIGLRQIPFFMDIPSPLLTIRKNIRDKKYIIVIATDDISSKEKNSFFENLLFKKMHGWKNYAVQTVGIDKKEKCGICLETMDTKGNLIKTTCEHPHFFHYKCFERMIIENIKKKNNPTCPLCRTKIPLQLL